MGLPSYVVNFDELSNLIKDYLQNGVKVDIGNISFSTKDMERLLSEIKDKIQGVDYNDLINALNALGVKLDNLSGNLGISGTQKIYGKMLEIPAVKGQHVIEFKGNGQITGITYSQSSWRFEDNWDLQVGNDKLFESVRTKEYGEHKFFNVFYPINGTVKFIYNNISGTSKVLWVDFNILENSNLPTPTTPTIPTTSEKNYRFLAIGESEYTLQGANNLTGCTYDADNMSNLFKEHKQSAKFIKNIVAKNKTKSEALNLIKNTFQDAQDNDISYLFWSGHGTVYEDKFALVAKDNIITVYELQAILDDIKGTKVIFIDTCHSGLAIDKNFAYTLAVVEEKLRSIDKTLNKQGYKVLTASAGSETSGDLSAGYNGNPNPSGAFTWALTQSIKTKKSDKDKNRIVTLEELYQSVLHFYDEFNIKNPYLKITQTAQVYPRNDTSSIFEYKEGA